MDKVSVIIPKRKGENIDGLINSVKHSTYQPIEIIVVDYGLERSAQRNIGISNATGKYLLILDSDQWVSPDLIRECVKLIQYSDGIYIPEQLVVYNWFDKVRNWERQFYTGTAVDCVRFVRKEDCPLFDESMSGPEDADWDRRIPVRVGKAVSMNCIYHHEKVSMMQYFKKKAYYAKSMTNFKNKHPNDPVLRFKYRCWTVFVENGKWKRLIRRPDLTIVVGMILLIRGVIYLIKGRV